MGGAACVDTDDEQEGDHNHGAAEQGADGKKRRVGDGPKEVAEAAIAKVLAPVMTQKTRGREGSRSRTSGRES